jgi:hypothetical protein
MTAVYSISEHTMVHAITGGPVQLGSRPVQPGLMCHRSHPVELKTKSAAQAPAPVRRPSEKIHHSPAAMRKI